MSGYQPFFYKPVGRCIYCGATTYDSKNGKLHDEHIIPYSLNGGLVLPEASCKKCEGRTHAYEGAVAGKIFGLFRAKYGVQTRNPKKRPTEVEITTRAPDGSLGSTRVPISEHPAPAFIYKFDQPVLLQHREPNEKRFKWQALSITGDREAKELIEKYHWDGIAKIKPLQFEMARTLAKIGYSYAVAEVGLGSFRIAPTLLKVILDKSNNVSYCVGGDWELPPSDPTGRDVLSLEVYVRQPKIYLVVGIRLFPAFGTPQYRVVVGDFNFKNPQHVAVFQEKMRDAVSIKPSLPVG